MTCNRYVIFSAGIPVSSTNKTDHHDITAILLKVALNTINLTLTLKINLIISLVTYFFSSYKSEIFEGHLYYNLFSLTLNIYFFPEIMLGLVSSSN